MAKTLSHIAERAGVHLSLVSRVLRADPKARVSDAKRALILSLAEEMGYRPNRMARSLRTKKTQILGMLNPDITNVFHSVLFKAVERAASARGYSVILCNTDDDEGRLRQLADLLAEGHVDGLLIATAKKNDPTIPWLESLDIPFVLLNRRPARADALWIGPDDHASGELAATHLGQLGHRRSLVLLGDTSLNNIELREKGFRAGSARFGIDPSELRIVGDLRGREDTMAALETLAPEIAGGGITAVYASNTLLSQGVVDFLFRRDWRVPEDLSVVGYSVDADPVITSIVPPVVQIGTLAARSLIDILSGSADKPIEPREIVLPVEIVDKGSTRMPGSRRAPDRN